MPIIDPALILVICAIVIVAVIIVIMLAIAKSMPKNGKH